MRLAFFSILVAAFFAGRAAQAEEAHYKLQVFAQSFGAVTDSSGASNYNYTFVEADDPSHLHILSLVEEPNLLSDRAIQALTNACFLNVGAGKGTKATLYLSCQSEPFCWDERGKQICSYVLKTSATGSHPSNCVLTQYYVGQFK